LTQQYPGYPQEPQPWPPQQPYSQPGQPGQPPPYPPQYAPPGPPSDRPPRGRGWVRRHKVLTALGAVVAIIVVSVIASGGKQPAPAATPAAATLVPATTVATAAPAAKSSAPAAVSKITYVVTGTAGDAQVTYGPEGSTFTGNVPMRVTKRLGTAGYYAIQAQLQGGGKVTVRILVNGKVISTGTADGGYNIAMAEISQNPITGKWEDTQG